MSPKVLLVDDSGAADILPVAEALARAQAEGLDLIEISPKADPPVVKIGDLGQFLYQMQKKDRKQRAHSKQTEVKTLRLSFRTEKHDINRLMDRAREFFSERHLVKFGIRLRGREFTNQEYAKDKLRGIVTALADASEVDQEMKKQGNQYIVVLRPKRGGGS